MELKIDESLLVEEVSSKRSQTEDAILSSISTKSHLLPPRSAFKVKFVKGGSIGALVDKLTWFQETMTTDSLFISDFLYCFHLILTPLQFFRLLLDKFHSTHPAFDDLLPAQKQYFNEQVLFRIRKRFAHS